MCCLLLLSSGERVMCRTSEDGATRFLWSGDGGEVMCRSSEDDMRPFRCGEDGGGVMCRSSGGDVRLFRCGEIGVGVWSPSAGTGLNRPPEPDASPLISGAVAVACLGVQMRLTEVCPSGPLGALRTRLKCSKRERSEDV